ncbi:hypothetical protein BpHYR1_046871 [Brachionus plicatilis]|uniref:Uncharacterized protein n=1 Tax=Brachionus plicatilis TaxID=10195 RepID=A0A3M7TBL7_BRAPC|nr:hypothetical protein BpHYR1_046871 [Brachionus plicatilis]
MKFDENMYKYLIYIKGYSFKFYIVLLSAKRKHSVKKAKYIKLCLKIWKITDTLLARDNDKKFKFYRNVILKYKLIARIKIRKELIRSLFKII